MKSLDDRITTADTYWEQIVNLTDELDSEVKGILELFDESAGVLKSTKIPYWNKDSHSVNYLCLMCESYYDDFSRSRVYRTIHNKLGEGVLKIFYNYTEYTIFHPDLFVDKTGTEATAIANELKRQYQIKVDEEREEYRKTQSNEYKEYLRLKEKFEP